MSLLLSAYHRRLCLLRLMPCTRHIIIHRAPRRIPRYRRNQLSHLHHCPTHRRTKRYLSYQCLIKPLINADSGLNTKLSSLALLTQEDGPSSAWSMGLRRAKEWARVNNWLKRKLPDKPSMLWAGQRANCFIESICSLLTALLKPSTLCSL